MVPKNLLVIAGINKIVETLEDGFKKSYGSFSFAPKNIEKKNK